MFSRIYLVVYSATKPRRGEMFVEAVIPSILQPQPGRHDAPTELLRQLHHPQSINIPPLRGANRLSPTNSSPTVHGSRFTLLKERRLCQAD